MRIASLILILGRGVLLASADQTISGLCYIYKAAITAGVDWVEYTGDDYIRIAVGNEGMSARLYYYY